MGTKIVVLNRETVQWRMPAIDAMFLSDLPGVVWGEVDHEGDVVMRITRNALGVVRERGLLPAEPDFRHHVPQTQPVVLNAPLFKHQREAVERATRRGALLLGDVMGLGKTRSALAIGASVQQPGRPTLIVGPKYVESIWRAEIAALGLEPELFWAARGADPSKRPVTPGAKWLFCHYDILRHWWNALSFNRFSAVLFDEAHLVKNPRSARGKSATLVTPGTAVRVVLTGTPVQNHLSEAHALLSLATGPGTWGREFDFRRRYCGAFQNDFGWQDSSQTHVDELQQRLDDVYLRRDTSVLEEKLPERVRRKVEVDLPESQAASVAELLKGYTPRQIFEALRKSAAGCDTLGWLMRLRKATSRAKFQTTVELANSILEQGDSVLVFTWQREMAERIAEGTEGQSGAFCVHGEFSQVERDRRVAQWKAHVEPRALVATYGTLSTGHTLTKANHVIFHDLDLVPANMLQAEARVYRIGATRPVQSWWTVARGTLDPFIFNLVNRKAPATAVFGDLGTGELGDFFGDDALVDEIAALIAHSEDA